MTTTILTLECLRDEFWRKFEEVLVATPKPEQITYLQDIVADAEIRIACLKTESEPEPKP